MKVTSLPMYPIKSLIKFTNKYKWALLCITLTIVGAFFYFYTKKEGFNNNINFMDGADVIYWINLDRSTERKENMLKMLDDLVFQDIQKIRITATDGKKPDEMYQKLGEYNKQESTTDLEYGCLLSHMDAIRSFYESTHNIALILEDDNTLEFKKYWKKSIKQITNNAPDDWDTIMLWYNVGSNGFKDAEYNKYNGEDGTVAYLVSRKGAEKLIKNFYKDGKYNLTNDFHHKSDVYIYRKLNTYVYKYPMFVFRTNNDSEIHKDHVDSLHNVSKRNAVAAHESEL